MRPGMSRISEPDRTIECSSSARSIAETSYSQVRNADPTSDSADNFPAIGNAERVVNAKNALRTAQAEEAAS